jgi:signal transduction histidine kinase
MTMAGGMRSPAPAARPGKIVIGAVYLLYAAVVLRTLTNPNVHLRLPVYLALELAYLILFTLALWRPPHRMFWKHLYFIVQSTQVLALILLRPRFDFIVILYVILCLQVVLIFPGRARWIWVAVMILLTAIPLMTALGALFGLSLALMPMTIAIVFAAYVAVTQEIETRLRNRQILLDELQAANQQLTVSASQVEELSAIQERNRLARELHDSVSQTMFSIGLHTRAAQIMLERDPDCLRPQLEQLQILAHNALEEMRGLIAQLRPHEGESVGRPKP